MKLNLNGAHQEQTIGHAVFGRILEVLQKLVSKDQPAHVSIDCWAKLLCPATPISFDFIPYPFLDRFDARAAPDLLMWLDAGAAPLCLNMGSMTASVGAERFAPWLEWCAEKRLRVLWIGETGARQHTIRCPVAVCIRCA
jgi:hypothetical protein